MLDETKILQVEGVYHSLFEQNQSAILLIDYATLRIVDANPAACSFYGYNKPELLAKTVTEIIVQPEAQHLINTDPAIAGCQKWFKVQHRLANGDIRQVEVHSSPIQVHGRQLLSWIIPGITGGKQPEQELHRRNRELTLLNQVIAASVTSSEPEEFLASTCRELAQAFDLPHVVALLLSDDKRTARPVAGFNANGSVSLSNGLYPIGPESLLHTIFSLASPLVVADVQHEARLAHLQPLFCQNGISSLLLLPLTVEGRVIGLLALLAPEVGHFVESHLSLGWTVADQIAGALTRIQLQKQRTQLSAVIEQTADSVVITDAENTVLYVNPAFEKVTGYSRADIIGQTPNILKSGKHTVDFYRTLWQTISSGRVWRGRFVNRKKDGSLFTEDATITPIRDEQGAIINYVAVKRDVTRELELEEQYRQSQKMEAIGSLAGGIAHDFNNILTGTNGFAELLQMQLPPDSPYQELVTRIMRGGQRATELVRQLLAFSRKQVVEPRVLDLNSVVSDLERMVLHFIGEHIQLTTNLAPQLWPIKADPTQLEQIMLNLAINARDAMPTGGQLKFETANVTLADETIPPQLELEGGEFVRLTVSDTGIGMSAEVKAHIFEPFFTTKELGRGTGLGLATVYGIVRQNSGFIWVDSEPGQGATFKIYLPRVAEVVTPQPQPEPALALARGSETILLVEDEPHVRELAAEMLSRQGYRVIVAADGTEALGLAAELNGRFDLLVTDVIMPRLNGPDLAGRLKAIQPDLKILYVSGYTAEVVACHGVMGPDAVLLSKPFSPMLLAQKVRQVLETNNHNHTKEAVYQLQLPPAA